MSKTVQISFFISVLLVGGGLSIPAGTPNSSGVPLEAARHWTADNGNGTYSNPLFYEEFEDPDVIRVGEDYYLAGTTMHMNPAVQIMHSKDLVNWELVGYCAGKLDLGSAYRLEGGNIYGRGIWAPCIRYHKGTFYIFSNVNGAGLLVFRSKSIQGPWERNQLQGRHDLSVLFDDDDKIYIISGGGSPYPIEELTSDITGFVPGVRHQLVGRMGEGHHLYKIKGKYVDVSAIPGGPVDQMVAIADSIDGPWKGAIMPWRDAFIAAFSVAAQVLQARKNLENWPLWVVVNLVAIVSYWSAELAYTAFLYAIYLVLAFAGWREWRRAMKGAAAPPSPSLQRDASVASPTGS